MEWLTVPAKLIAAGLLVTGIVMPQLLCQSSKTVDGTDGASVQSDLISAAEAEERKGEYVFYTQSYVDSEKQKVSYRGSIYGAIQNVVLDGCLLKVNIQIVDKFSGVVGKKQTGEQADSQHYSVRLTLTSKIADALQLVEARPVQLANGTNSVCPEKPSCAFTWIAIREPKTLIKESRTTNEFVDFDGHTDHFLVPVSSADAGKQLIQRIRTLAQAHCESR